MTFTGVQADADSVVKHAVVLLSQQCWCWGRDILRPEGNWLMELGFEKIEPPPNLIDRGSVYQMQLAGDRQLVLRGFGVFLGRPGIGGVFLPRYEFTPKYTELSQLDSPPWASDLLPPLERLNSSNRGQCAQLTRDLISWIAEYEADVADRLGVDYRRQTLSGWDDGTKVTVAAKEFASAWRQLANQLGTELESIFPETCRNE